jgi:electron transfer flavoprotein alpha subunit
MQQSAAFVSLLARFQPGIVLVPSTPFGREIAARAAARLGLGLTADCLDVAVDGDSRLVQFKPALGGMVVARIRSRSAVQLATVRTGVLPLPAPVPGRTADVETMDVGTLPDDPVRLLKRVRDVGDAGLALERADIVIGVGTGIEGDWNLPIVRELANVMGAAIGSTRRAVETGIMPGQLQIGLTGKAVAPRLYLALGVKGNLNHMIGSMRAGTIVAVNLDPEADIFKAADFGVVGDVLKIVPLLTDELKRRGYPTGGR